MSVSLHIMQTSGKRIPDHVNKRYLKGSLIWVSVKNRNRNERIQNGND